MTPPLEVLPLSEYRTNLYPVDIVEQYCLKEENCDTLPGPSDTAVSHSECFNIEKSDTIKASAEDVQNVDIWITPWATPAPIIEAAAKMLEEVQNELGKQLLIKTLKCSGGNIVNDSYSIKITITPKDQKKGSCPAHKKVKKKKFEFGDDVDMTQEKWDQMKAKEEIDKKAPFPDCKQMMDMCKRLVGGIGGKTEAKDCKPECGATVTISEPEMWCFSHPLWKPPRLIGSCKGKAEVQCTDYPGGLLWKTFEVKVTGNACWTCHPILKPKKPK